MNQKDREDLATLTKAINALTEEAKALKTLKDIEPSLKDLAEIAPTLKEMSEGYKGAKWFTKAIKWVAALATAVLAIWGLAQVAMSKVLQGGVP